MAKVATKKAEIVYTLELSAREAAALTELLVTASPNGEGGLLDNVYCELCNAGAESDALSHEIVDGQVLITRSGR